MKITQLAIFLSVAMPMSGIAQVNDIIKNTPATPNSAALGKYGEVPVSPHTGVPNISVPLHTITGKDLALPIDLTYHASGIKVEELSSWVGLGWSLNAGGVITRQVRALPDEDFNGYFSNTTSNADFLSSPNYSMNVQVALAGQADYEPDMFFFNFAGESGKFVFDQGTDKFETVTRSGKKINYNSNTQGWEIISENGTRYYFEAKETNNTSTGCQANSVYIVTGWYLTRIVNYNRTDSILLDYTPYWYNFTTLKSSERKLILDHQEDCQVMGYTPGLGLCDRYNAFAAQRLTTIRFRTGKIEFQTTPTVRLDLDNDRSLQYIKIFNEKDELLTTYKMNQSYFGSSLVDYRLRLDGIEKIDGTQVEPYRNFEYEHNYLPGRLSFEQDYWGFYNGQSSNTSLIPTIMIALEEGTEEPLMVPGANRSASTIESIAQAGMLSKIVYPTGGYTSFEYENHRTSVALTPATIYNEIHLDRSAGEGPVYSTTFIVDHGPNVLNGNNPLGGAFYNILIDGITCDYGQISGQATYDCAIISLSGPKGATFTGNTTNFYLPDGTYTLTANFNNNPNLSSWEDFYVGVSWNELDETNVGSSVVGGLRIKSIQDYDPVSKQIAHKKHFKYHTESDTLVSSAVLAALPEYMRYSWYREDIECPPGVPCEFIYYCRKLRLTSDSNYPSSGSGGHTTYGFVTVLEELNGTKGKTTYEYSNVPDVDNNTYPFLPKLTNEWRRGQLLQQKEYGYRNNSFQLLKHVRNTYKLLDGTTTKGIRIYPMHLGEEIVYSGTTPAETFFSQGDYAVEFYNVDYAMYNYLDSTITKTFDAENPAIVNQTIEKHFIDANNLNVKRKVISTSDGSTLVTHFKYPDDYTNTGTDQTSIAIDWQKEHNTLQNVIEQTTWNKISATDSTIIGGALNLFRVVNGKLVLSSALALPTTTTYTESTISNNQFQYASPYEMEMEVLAYDEIGNPIEAVGKDGVSICFLWDQTKSQPIATIKGTSSYFIFYTGFEVETINTSTTAKTGEKSYTAGYTVNAPSAGTFNLTYWKKIGSGDWQLIETTFSGSVQIGGGAGVLIDEVRVYPPSAQITTYAYKPGIGVSSITDPNNITTRYEYDSFGRLKFIKDEKGDILKMFEYHYKSRQ